MSKKAPESFASSIFRVARETIEETLDSSREKLRDTVSDTTEDLRKEGRKLVKSTRTYVRKNPYSLVLVALGVGVVLGMLARRR